MENVWIIGILAYPEIQRSNIRLYNSDDNGWQLFDSWIIFLSVRAIQQRQDIFKKVQWIEKKNITKISNLLFDIGYRLDYKLFSSTPFWQFNILDEYLVLRHLWISTLADIIVIYKPNTSLAYLQISVVPYYYNVCHGQSLFFKSRN